MNIKHNVLNFLRKNSTLQQQSPQRLAFSTVVGLFIAFSPFLGLQTPLAIIVALIIRAPISYMLLIIYGANNPLITMIPVILASYFVGIILFTYILPHAAWARTNPEMVSWLTNKIAPYLQRYLGVQDLYFWYFMCGGLVFALLLSVPWYPYLVRFFRNLKEQLRNDSTQLP